MSETRLEVPWVALAQYLAATAARAAMARALPLYLAIGVASVILFGGNGLDAHTVTDAAENGFVLRAALFASWWVASLPVARAWLCDRSALAGRALPVPRAAWLGAFALGCVILQLPWAALWLRGASLRGATWAIGVALALESATLAGQRSATEVAALLAVVASAALPPSWFSAAICLAVFARALTLVHRTALEPAAQGRHWVIGSSRAVRYASALAVASLRGHGPVFVRALATTSATSLLPALYIHRNGGSPLLWALSFWAPACIAAATAIAGPLLRIDASLALLARPYGPVPLAARAVEVLCALSGAALGAAFSLPIGLINALDAASWAGTAIGGAVGGGVWALLTVQIVRRTTRGGAARAGQLITFEVLLALASIALIWASLPIGHALSEGVR